jgi:hypothetical protein
VASLVATTAGMPYSRATREACAARVPPSVTTAAARANSGVQAGAVARGDQDLAGLEAVEVTRSVDDADRAGGPAGAGWLPDDGVLWRWAGGAHGVHGAEEFLGEQPGWAADGQGGQQAPLPLPGGPPPANHIPQGGADVELGAGQEEHVLGPVDHAGSVEPLGPELRTCGDA